MEIVQKTLPAKEIDDRYIIFVAGCPFLVAAFRDHYDHRKFFLASMADDDALYNVQLTIPFEVEVQVWHITDFSQGLHGV